MFNNLWKDPYVLSNLSEELKNDKEVVLVALKQSSKHVTLLDWVSEELRNDKETVLEAVKQNVKVLKYVSEELRNDKGIVLKAVKQDGELSPEYAKKQIEDENYKYKNEESRIKVANRIKGVINDIIENNRGKRIYICTHANALLSYFSKIGNAYHKDDKYIIDVCNKNIFEDFKGWGKHSPELFKLVFNEQNEIIEFENINW